MKINNEYVMSLKNMLINLNKLKYKFNKKNNKIITKINRKGEQKII
jgi:hypothetical protein